MHILLINGPNLNMLGTREPGLYGDQSLTEIETLLINKANKLGCQLKCFQSNAEHELINEIHKAMDTIDGIIINPGAFTHTSIALRDALLCVNKPFIEVHLSNIYKREAFRQKSYFSDIATACIIGLGPKGYDFALDAIHQTLQTTNTQ